MIPVAAPAGKLTPWEGLGDTRVLDRSEFGSTAEAQGFLPEAVGAPDYN